ncbi:MAG: hypothetical protein JO051_06375 [Acidobacteriaceae bacterium]|nr:hypothetical protein [Acidobacteriaceae bacterium]
MGVNEQNGESEMSMVERVARAICKAQGEIPHFSWAFIPEKQDQPDWRKYEPIAKSAIEALAEPNNEMVQASFDAVELRVNAAVHMNNMQARREIYRAMIRAALLP